MARADRGPSKKPFSPSQAGEALSREQLPLVRVPRGKAKSALRVTVVCESSQRSSKLLDVLHKAMSEAGLAAQEPLCAEELALLHGQTRENDQSALPQSADGPQRDASIMLAIFDARSAVAAPTGCVLVCDSISDHVLRAAFASCAAGIVTREGLVAGDLTAKLREAREVLIVRRASLPTQSSATSLGTTQAPHGRTKREDRLLKAARNIAASRDALASQLAMVCEQLSQSCMDVSSQLSHVAIASELQTLLRQELDIESVLRTCLEFLLRRLGPANAAIYLPSTTGDYTLGAYINYDCPRDGIEQTLNHLGEALAPDFENRPGLHVLGECERDLPAVTSAWVQDSTMLVYTAHADDECAAIIAVFRDQTTGFDAASRKLVSTIGGMLGEQLTRIVKTHHRWKAA
jgi:hypothetical protein